MSWLLLLALGCTSGGGGRATCDDPEDSEVGVVSVLTFARQVEGVSNGFDLDGEGSTCGVDDFTAPDGSGNIDNSLARLVPALEATEASAAEPLIQQSINSGELLFLFDVTGVDSLEDDDCVHFEMFRGAGAPDIGTHGRINDGQTFDRDPEVPSSVDAEASIVDGRLIAQDLTIEVPIEIFDASLTLVLEDASVAIDYAPDGSFTGYLGGSLDYGVIIDMALDSNVDQALANALPVLFDNNADLTGPDGPCTRLSTTLEFEGVGAFLFAEDAL